MSNVIICDTNFRSFFDTKPNYFSKDDIFILPYTQFVKAAPPYTSFTMLLLIHTTGYVPYGLDFKSKAPEFLFL